MLISPECCICTFHWHRYCLSSMKMFHLVRLFIAFPFWNYWNILSVDKCYLLCIYTILSFVLWLLVIITRALVEVIWFYMLYIYQVYGEDEWSFGFCEQGTGVFSCPSGKNPMYTYRECIVLGQTSCSIFKVNQVLRELSREWAGSSYDLLSKNCNHFCDEFCERLGVPKLPGKNIIYFHDVYTSCSWAWMLMLCSFGFWFLVVCVTCIHCSFDIVKQFFISLECKCWIARLYVNKREGEERV